MKKSLKILDKIYTRLVFLGFLAMVIYASILYPESKVVPFAWLGSIVYVYWIGSDICFWINKKRIARDIQTYINSGFNPNSVKRYSR